MLLLRQLISHKFDLDPVAKNTAIQSIRILTPARPVYVQSYEAFGTGITTTRRPENGSI